MSAPEERWWSVRAGEYVLGTLRGEDLELFENVLQSDTEMQASVSHWERRLAGLNETVAEQSPGPHVWPKIVKKVKRLEVAGPKTGKGSSVADVNRAMGAQRALAGQSAAGASRQVSAANDSSAPWQSWAGLATAASLLLGILLMHGKFVAPEVPPLSVDGVAVVLSDDSGEPFFLVETDYGNLQVRVTALAPPPLDKTHDFQLWQALPDRASVRPVALLPEQAGAARTFTVDALVEGSDLFGVSIEPTGAETDAGPTGPVVAHGNFLRTSDVE